MATIPLSTLQKLQNAVSAQWSKSEETDEEIFADIRDYARRRLRQKHPYLPQTALDQLLDKISGVNDDLAKLAPEIEASKTRSNFFSLPSELRNYVYELVLLKNVEGKKDLPLPDTTVPITVGYCFLYSTAERKPALLRVSQQVRAEASPIYHSNTFLIESMPLRLASDGLIDTTRYTTGPRPRVIDTFTAPREKLSRWLTLIGRQRAGQIQLLLRVYSREDESIDNITLPFRDDPFYEKQLGDLSLKVRLPWYTKR